MTAGERATMRLVAQELREKILGGVYAPEQRVPSREELADEYDVSRETAGLALRALRDEGLVTLEQGRGTYVRRLRRYRVTVRLNPKPAAAPGPGRPLRLDMDSARREMPWIPAPETTWGDAAAGQPGATVTVTATAADGPRAHAQAYEFLRRAAGPDARRWDLEGADADVRAVRDHG